MTPEGGGPTTPGLVPRLVVAAVVLALPLIAVGIGLAVALSASTEATRGGLVAAMVAWGLGSAAAVGVIATFAWSVVGPARRLAAGSEDLARGGRGDLLPRDRSDEFGRAARAVQQVADGRASLSEQLRDSAVRDPETGFYDARELRSRLDQEHGRSRRYGRPYTLVVVDIDRDDGDVAGVAAAIDAAVRPTDVVGRLSDTGFVALLPETTAKEAMQVVQRLRSGLGRGLSGVGLCDHPDGAATSEQVLRAAVSALDASRQRRGEPVVYGGG